jgi:hypothetical protein
MASRWRVPMWQSYSAGDVIKGTPCSICDCIFGTWIGVSIEGWETFMLMELTSNTKGWTLTNGWPNISLLCNLYVGIARSSPQHCSLTQLPPEPAIRQQVSTVTEVNTAPPFVGLKIQMFLRDAWSGSTGLTLSNQHHSTYRHYVLIPSEQVPFCLDKFIPEALPLLEAPPAVCLVQLYKLLCGVVLVGQTASNALSVRELRQETVKNLMDPCWEFCGWLSFWICCLAKNVRNV